MPSQQRVESAAPIDLEIENIGGIDARSETLLPGITVLVGANATNRTSFLQAIMAALGSTRATLKGDAQEGRVSMTVDDATYTRTLSRTDSTIRFSGDAYLDDPELAELYAFLLGDNDIRQTVEQNGDLHEVLMRPVDTEHIEAELESLRETRRDIEADLENVNEAAEALPRLEEERQQLEAERDALRDEIEAVEADVERLQREVLSGEQEDRIEALNEQVEETQTELAAIETEISQLEARIDGIQRELEDAGSESDESVDALQEQIEDLEAERRSLKETINTLEELEESFSAAADMSRRLLNSTQTIEDLITQVPTEIDIPDGPLTDRPSERSDSPTDQLVAGEEQICRGCGSEVTTDEIRAIIDQYAAIQRALHAEIETHTTTANALEADKRELEQQLRERKQTKNRRERLRTELEQQETKLEDAYERRDELAAELDALRDEMATLDTDGNEQQDELVDRRTELNTTKSELARVERQLEEIEREIDRKEEVVDKRDELEAEREHLDAQIADLQTRVETIEQELVDEFNDTMDEVLSLLAYQNLARIWIDRKVVDQNGTTGDNTQFELNVVRDGAGGTYEDRFEHLSESEQAVTGLAVALTGYLVHEVYDACPVMLLDSIEMIDGERIAALLEYFGAKADYLVAALLPEDRDTIETETVNIIDWSASHD